MLGPHTLADARFVGQLRLGTDGGFVDWEMQQQPGRR
jgi:hypothetical protein